MPFSQVGLGAWTTLSPAATVTSGTGTITTIAAVTNYRIEGKTVNLNIVITNTTNGTGATSYIVSGAFPVAPKVGARWSGSGWRSDTPFTAMKVALVQANNNIVISDAAGAYPGASGGIVTIDLEYETV